MNTLFLRLEGPLQAWGFRARWGERDTGDAPTKSGVIGLLGCALGLQRNDPMLRQMSDALRMGVRVDLPGTLLRDYHTTGGGRYGDVVHTGGDTRFHDEPYVGGVLSPEVSKEGRIKVKFNKKMHEPETDTSDRYYLADASFLVALQSADEALIGRLADALQAPVWPCFLGRKSCVPSMPIFAGVELHAADDLADILAEQTFSQRTEWAWERGDRPSHLRLLLEVGPGEGNPQNDAIAMPARRVFRPRYVIERFWSLPGEIEPPINTLEG